jgi:uncharacterized protein YdeI (BOF family)
MFSVFKIVVIYISILFIITGCATPIRKINKSPEKYHGKKIYVRGEVISSIELIDLYSFTIRDKSGKIMVVTENRLPLQKDRIRVYGMVDKNFNYRERNIVVIKEKKMKGIEMEDPKKKIREIYNQP